MSSASASFLHGPSAATSDPSANFLQRVIDEAAYFNLFSTADGGPSNPVIRDSSGSVIGMQVRERLHRFCVSVAPSSPERPMKARNVVGEPAGRFSHRWMLAPDDWEATPDRDPPPTPLDPSRSQRFVMMDSVCAFREGDDGFQGFGTGRTLPGRDSSGNTKILITAVGTILKGFGKFSGHDAGTYVYCGSLTATNTFQGNVLLRVMDPQLDLQTDADVYEFAQQTDPEPGVTYLMFRGQAVPSDSVTPALGADQQPTGLIVVQGLRLLELDFKTKGPGGLQSIAKVGGSIGQITATVTFDISAPGGSNLDPIPFLADDQFVFFDRHGAPNAGGFHANSTEGRVFKALLVGQPAIRFGGTGEILSGSGPLAGMTGLMTDNSVVSFTPHVSASVYLLRVDDPQRKFRIEGANHPRA
jgi:hypothetical protein